MNPTQAEEDRIMGPILRRLATGADQLQRELVRAHALGIPVPALNRKLSRVIGLLRLATRQAASGTPGLELADLKPGLDWRVAKVKSIATVIKADDDVPALGTLLGLPHQLRAFGSDLSGQVSDQLVTQHTQEQEDKASFERDEVLIFQPERDACVQCLAYAGRFRHPDETFPAGLSLDPDAPKPDKKQRLLGPPVHRHCRCELVVIPREAAPSNSKVLKREAERSALKGWALPSESNAARVRAAQALLDANVIAPKTVLAETRRRLKADAPFVRDVP